LGNEAMGKSVLEKNIEKQRIDKLIIYTVE
jgi:hypothetical protein